VKKEGKNKGFGAFPTIESQLTASKGKQFWSCPKPVGQSCGFTQWINDAKTNNAVVKLQTLKTPKTMSFSKIDESNFRAKGISLYVNCELIRRYNGSSFIYSCFVLTFQHSSGSKSEKNPGKPALYIKLSSKVRAFKQDVVLPTYIPGSVVCLFKRRSLGCIKQSTV